jgi:D-serine deaminase-like pyridoxal phosphate-dependent protein
MVTQGFVMTMLPLTGPTLLLDKEKCFNNIMAIIEKARKNAIAFRPHFKTHQSLEIGKWFRNLGVTKITVSSLKMAEYFADDGWDDITVAFPVNVHEKSRINKLAKKITLNLLVVSSENIEWLARETQYAINLFIEIDNGSHRSGLAPTDTQTIDAILSATQQFPQLQFAGFLAHAGHSYKVVGDRNKIKAVHHESLGILHSLKEKYVNQYPNLVLSPGDTPTCSVAENFEGVDEIRPGNLVFYDYMQYHIGSCSLEQIAVAMACPVVAVYPERNEVVVHGGAVHLSKDFIALTDGKPCYGKVVTLTDIGWNTEETGMYVKSLSQEHGIIHAENAGRIKIGDWLGVLPIHSCLTADAMKSYLTLEGERISMMH